jgi:hypothetical protein
VLTQEPEERHDEYDQRYHHEGCSHSDSGMMNGRTNLWGKIAHEFTPEEAEPIRDGLVRPFH